MRSTTGRRMYWQPGTKFFVNVQTGGVPMGDGYYGNNDLTVDASITDQPMPITTDDKTHMLTVTSGRQGREEDAGQPRQAEHAVVVRRRSSS